MRETLRDEVRAFLESHGAATASDVAVGVRARRADVDRVLADTGSFETTTHPAGGSPAATYWRVSPHVPVPQWKRIVAVLADRRPHSMQEIHAKAGFCRLNSRVSELRSRGYEITCDKTGGNYIYTLVSTPDDLLDEPAAGAVAGSSSGTSADPTASLSVNADPDPGDPDDARSNLTLFPSRGAYGEAA